MTEAKTRIVGLVMFLAGVFIAYQYVYLPLEAAESHAPQVNLSLKMTFMMPTFVLFGALAAIFGQRGSAWLQDRTGGVRKMKKAGWVFAAVCIAAGIGLHEWLEATLKASGYGH